MRIAPLIVAGILAAPLVAQVTRTPVQIDTGAPTDFHDATVGVDGDLAVAAFVQQAPDQVYVTTSDGRGLAWSPPLRLDTDASGGTKDIGWSAGNPNLVVSGTNVYIVWHDGRTSGGGRGVYFARSTDSGATWTETRLDDGLASPGGIPEYTMSVSLDPAGDHLYVAVATRISGAFFKELHLTSSHDGGATWSAAVDVSTMNGAAHASLPGLASDGSMVHCIWSDRRASLGDPDIYYRRSIDGGATFGAELQVDGSGPASGYAEYENVLACEGSTVAAIWIERPEGTSTDAVHAVISTDGGATFGPDQPLGVCLPGSNDCEYPELVVAAGNVVAYWVDYRTGSPRAYTSTTPDGGTTWTPDTLLSSSSAIHNRLDAHGSDVTATWVGFSSGFGRTISSVFSTDGGLTWSSEVWLTPQFGSSAGVGAGFSDLYRNWIVAWTQQPSGVWGAWAGGFRPQTLTPTGFIGPGSVGFTLSDFGTAPFGYVVASASPGSLPVASTKGLRDLGLTLDPLMNLTFQDPVHFLLILGGLGQGSTVPLTVSLSGVTLYSAAFTFNLGLDVDELTDVVPIVIP